MNGMTTSAVAGAGPAELTPSTGSRDKKRTEKGIRVVIVEDHDASRHCLEGFLQKDGYSVCSFPCAEDGLVQLEADHFDVLLTDLHLPGMDGFELIAKAKAVQPSIHILMMTAAASEKVYERAQVAGVDALFEKPIELEELLAFLDIVAYPGENSVRQECK